MSCSKVHKHRLPPVVDGWQQKTASRNAYVVQKKDTLYSIAWAFGMDYRELAKRNNIKPPYTLRYKQHLYIVKTQEAAAKKGKNKPILLTNNIKTLKDWTWPVNGRVVASFTNKLGGNKGIDISGKFGEPVVACSAGKVVYSGTGIPAYGKLLIVKHSDDYLSAYAHNSKMFVHEGQEVKAGQKIAAIGRDDLGNVRLHFEIRKVGKPVNPLFYLPKKI